VGDLRRAWRDVPTPELPDDAAELDERTRAVVLALRGAWRALPAPPASSRDLARGPRALVPHRPSDPPRRAGRDARRGAFRRLAAAAVLLIAALGVALAWHARRGTSPVRELPRESVAVLQDPEPLIPDLLTPAPPGAAARVARATPAAIGADHLELRSGPVRLLLLDAHEPKLEPADLRGTER
jgi:hypothetical protein